ncbi:response regulator transcription factor [Paenibacillus sp. HW567]|uniref:response regulator transcription factor n=1 Tax=Paenibacillus sp. HW567 TaxID=1034769 RepID=UPI00036C623F|nr:response regulator [Paenibacillus sp. HW567]
MLNLMIVDDEELIRKDIKSKITRISHPAISSIIMAANGLEAKQAIQNYKPEIIISDIRMPGMDGISLIRECSKTNPMIKFIVLSGHDDYRYVREAFKYGIVDYLLKPVRLSELELQLNKAILQHNYAAESATTASGNTLTDEIRAKLIATLHGDDLTKMTTGLSGYESLEAKWSIFRFLYEKHHAGHIPNTERIQVMLEDLLMANMEDKAIRCVTLNADRDGGTIAINYNENVMIDELMLLLRKLVDHLAVVCSTRVMAALSSAYTCSNINDANIETGRILSYRILYEGSFVLTAKAMNDKRIQLPLNDIEIERLSENLRTLNIEKSKEEIADWFTSRRLQTIDTASIRQMYLMILTEMHRWHCDKLPSENICRDDDFNRHHSLLEIQMHLFKQLDSINRAYSQPGVRSKSAISLVKQYIEEHPLGEVTLAEVSNLVSMNYTYFSTWFKMEVGLTFSAYIMKQRMEKAKRLLEEPATRIREVAVRVGYENMYHFSRAFKNYTGLSPKEYRKSAEDL